MKTVNLEEILFKHLTIARKKLPRENWYDDEHIKASPEFKYFIDAMEEACRQTLELAAENANVSVFDYIDKDFKEFRQNKNVYIINDGNYVQIDKQSILDTINQIQ